METDFSGRDILSAMLGRLADPQGALLPSDALLADLREIASRHRGKPFVIDPVGIEFVGVTLGGLFGRRPAELQPMTEKIAQTLFDDSLTRARLERFWDALCRLSS